MSYTTKENSAAQEECTCKGTHWIKNMVKTWLNYAFWAKDAVATWTGAHTFNDNITMGTGKKLDGWLALQDVAITDTSTTQVMTIGGMQKLNNEAALTCTLANPAEAGILMVITQIDAGTAGHTVTCATAAALDGTNKKATFNAQYETLVLMSVATNRWVIVENVGSVGLATV